MITCFHSILLCHTKPLHVLDHYIQQTLLRSCSFPPAWKLHLQHSLSNISTLSLFHVFASSAVPVIPYSRSHYHIANTSFHSSCDHSVISTHSILPAFFSSLSVALDDWHQTLKLILFPSLPMSLIHTNVFYFICTDFHSSSLHPIFTNKQCFAKWL